MTGVLNAMAGIGVSPRLTARAISANSTGSPAIAELEFLPSGALNTIVDTGSGGVVTSRLPEWRGWHYAIPGGGAGYEIRCEVLAGASPDGADATDTWLSLATERSWYLFRAAAGSASGEWLVQIRNAGGDVVAQATYLVSVSVS